MLVNLQDIVGQLDDDGVEPKQIVKLMRESKEAIVPTALDKLFTGTRRRIHAVGTRIATVTQD